MPTDYKQAAEVLSKVYIESRIGRPQISEAIALCELVSRVRVKYADAGFRGRMAPIDLDELAPEIYELLEGK